MEGDGERVWGLGMGYLQVPTPTPETYGEHKVQSGTLRVNWEVSELVCTANSGDTKTSNPGSGTYDEVVHKSGLT